MQTKMKCLPAPPNHRPHAWPPAPTWPLSGWAASSTLLRSELPCADATERPASRGGVHLGWAREEPLPEQSLCRANVGGRPGAADLRDELEEQISPSRACTGTTRVGLGDQGKPPRAESSRPSRREEGTGVWRWGRTTEEESQAGAAGVEAFGKSSSMAKIGESKREKGEEVNRYPPTQTRKCTSQFYPFQTQTCFCVN